MAEPYYSKLKSILVGITLPDVNLECRHFFNGAAAYANGRIFGSLSPAGFAIKLPGKIRRELIESGDGRELRFFPQGPIKKNYVRINEDVIKDDERLMNLMIQAAKFVKTFPPSRN